MAEKLQVFILGPARSGTSILFYAMQKVFKLPGEGESHVMPGFQRVIFTFARYAESFAGAEGVLAIRLDGRAFRTHTIDHIRTVYDEIFPGGSFVDKTPGAEAIVGVPLIREVFPEARIMLTRRTGIEVVQSHVKKFSADFSEACRSWSAGMEAIAQVRRSIQDTLELDQYDLANDTSAAAYQIASYLGSAEKAGELENFLIENRTDSVSSHDWRNRLLLADVAWTDQEKATFVEICGSQMNRFGYPM